MDARERLVYEIKDGFIRESSGLRFANRLVDDYRKRVLREATPGLTADEWETIMLALSYAGDNWAYGPDAHDARELHQKLSQNQLSE